MADAFAPTVALPKMGFAKGQRFADRYEIQDLLGEGGMGAVYRVLDTELNEEVALKLVHPELANEPASLERFRREVKLARRVTHPNVARTYDLGAHLGTRYLTMELLEGVALSKRLKSGALPLADALRIAAEIARGLQAAHTVGVVHRDLKPDNVMISDRRIAITDFGIARLAEGVVQPGTFETNATGGWVIVGTPAYMAPEQLEGRELDGRADVYALGLVLFELITGRLPFTGDTPFAMAAARLTTTPVDPRTLVPSIPEAVAKLVLGALARRRDERLDAQAFLARIDAQRRGHDVDLEAVGPVSVAPMPDVKAGPRRIAIMPVTHDEAAAPMAEQAREALVDAVSGLRGGRIVPLAADAELTLETSVRVSGGVARVRVRIVDVATTAQVWRDQFDLPAADAFAVEDQLTTRVVAELQPMLAAGGHRGPRDKSARALYDAAMTKFDRGSIDPKNVEEVIALLEEADRLYPNDPWIMSALGNALSMLWNNRFDAPDNSLITRAEELALRALAVDSSVGESHATIAIVRLQYGELREAVRSFTDAIARAPLDAKAHDYLGQLLGETGHVDEAYRRLDLAARLDHKSALRSSTLEGGRIAALMNDTTRYERYLGTLRVQSPALGAFLELRIALWRNDRAMLERIRASAVDAPAAMLAWAAPMIAAMEGKAMPYEPYVEMGAMHGSLRRRTLMYQLATEVRARLGNVDGAFETLEKASSLLLIDVLWLDRCPIFEGMRDDPRFARVRAVTAQRAASLWG